MQAIIYTINSIIPYQDSQARHLTVNQHYPIAASIQVISLCKANPAVYICTSWHSALGVKNVEEELHQQLIDNQIGMLKCSEHGPIIWLEKKQWIVHLWLTLSNNSPVPRFIHRAMLLFFCKDYFFHSGLLVLWYSFFCLVITLPEYSSPSASTSNVPHPLALSNHPCQPCRTPRTRPCSSILTSAPHLWHSNNFSPTSQYHAAGQRIPGRAAQKPRQHALQKWRLRISRELLLASYTEE